MVMELKETSKDNAQIKNWSRQNLWLIDKLLMLMLGEEKQTWSGHIGPRLAWALEKSWEGETTKTGKYGNEKNTWYVLSMAAVFWRIHGAPKEAMNCLLRSMVLAPQAVKDAPLVLLSDMVYRVGYLKDSIRILRDAMDIRNNEASTYLQTGNALQAANNFTGAIEFYNYALMLQPNYVQAFHSISTVKCRLVKENKVPALASLSKFDFKQSIAAAVFWYSSHENWMEIAADQLFKHNTFIDFTDQRAFDALQEPGQEDWPEMVKPKADECKEWIPGSYEDDLRKNIQSDIRLHFRFNSPIVNMLDPTMMFKFESGKKEVISDEKDPLDDFLRGEMRCKKVLNMHWHKISTHQEGVYRLMIDSASSVVDPNINQVNRDVAYKEALMEIE